MFKWAKNVTLASISIPLVLSPTLMVVSCDDYKFDYKVPNFEKLYTWQITDVYSKGAIVNGTNVEGRLKRSRLIELRDAGYDGFTNKDAKGNPIFTTANIDEHNFFGEVGTSTTQGFWSYFPKARMVAPFAFWSMGLKSIPSIPDRIESIHESAFYDNDINGVTFDNHDNFSANKLKLIGKNAFANNNISSLSSSSTIAANLPVNLHTIEYGAFSGNNLTSYLYLPDNLMNIGERAFYDNRINRLYLGKRLDFIDVNAFGQSENLSSIYRVKVTNPNTRFMGIKWGSDCYASALQGVFNEKWTGFTWDASELISFTNANNDIEYKTKDEGRYNIGYVINTQMGFDKWW